MKNKKIYILLFLISISGILNVNAATNPYPKSSTYGTNCTWYAWKITNEKTGINLPNLGNAKDWYKNAKNAGYNVGSTPKSKSIVVWGDWTSLGHVGYIEKAEDNIIYVWDSTGPCIDEEDPEYIECMANGVSEESDKICKANANKVACKYNISESDYSITGYIYLDNVPKTTTTKKTEKTTTIKKSSNNYLNNIKISSGNIDFDKDTFIYNINVENSIDSILIEAKTEDKKATITGIGEHKLKEGSNEIKLIVTAENNTKKEYIININRNKEIKENIVESKNDNSQNKPNINYLTIISLTFISFLIGVLVIKKK